MNRHRAEDGERRQPPVVAARKDLVDEDEPAARQHEGRRQRQRQDEPGKLLHGEDIPECSETLGRFYSESRWPVPVQPIPDAIFRSAIINRISSAICIS